MFDVLVELFIFLVIAFFVPLIARRRRFFFYSDVATF